MGSAIAAVFFAMLASACAAHYDLSLGNLDAGARARDARDATVCEGGACDDAALQCRSLSASDAGDACCRNDDDCRGDAPTCDRDSQRCVQCFSDADCEERPGKPQCVDQRCHA